MTLASDGGAFTYRRRGRRRDSRWTRPRVQWLDSTPSQQAVSRDRLQFVSRRCLVVRRDPDRKQDPRCPRL